MIDTTGLTEDDVALLTALAERLRELRSEAKEWARRDAEKTARIFEQLDEARSSQ